MQIVVYGHSGSGKTTLLINKLHQLYESHITTRCVLGVSFNQMILDAFDQLDPFYTSSTASTKKKSVSAGLSNSYLGIKNQIGVQVSQEESRSSSRLLPPQLTPQNLARFLGGANCCWVLEDFHKIESSEKIHLAQAMKVFMDMSDEYPDLKIVALGAVATAREVVESDSEMRNRVAEIYVPLMDDGEILKLIEKGETILNIILPKSIKKEISAYCNGLASVCHQLCLNICDAAGINQTQQNEKRITGDQLRKALEHYLENASDTLKAVFDQALQRKRTRKFDNHRIIIRALAECDSDGAPHAEILEKIRLKHPSFPSGNLTRYLIELQHDNRCKIVRQDVLSRKFSFSDPIYHAFAKSLFRDTRRSGYQSNVTNLLESIWVDYFEELKIVGLDREVTIVTKQREARQPRK